jgi:hypothetical protein
MTDEIKAEIEVSAEEKDLRAQAKSLGIKGWHLKGIDKLKVEIDSVSVKPASVFTPVDEEFDALQTGEPVVCHLRNGSRGWFPRALAEKHLADGYVVKIDEYPVDYLLLHQKALAQ